MLNILVHKSRIQYEYDYNNQPIKNIVLLHYNKRNTLAALI